MNEFVRFLRALYRNKITLIVVPLVAVTATYFLVRKLPEKYNSKARIATGLVDNGKLENDNVQESKIARDFDNILQNIKLEKVINMVSYQLLLHDMLHPDAAYRKPSDDLKKMSAKEKKDVIAELSDKYERKEELFLSIPREKKLGNLLASMQYDDGSILKSLTSYRVGSSDFILLEYTAENPFLSAATLNLICSEFINYYTTRQKVSNRNTVNFLDSLLQSKYKDLTSEMYALKDYKIKNNIFNLNEEGREMYSQIADMENHKKSAEKDVRAYGAAINDIDKKFNPQDRGYFESTVTELNIEINSLKEQIKALTDTYVKTNFDPVVKQKIEALQKTLNVKINAANDKYAYNPLSLKENLVQQKMTMETEKNLAENSIPSYESEIQRLNERLYNRVPNEAVIQGFEYKIDILGKEYIELLGRFNEANIASNFARPLKLAEAATPGDPLPNKNMLLIIIAGLVSFVFCVFIMFLFFYFDSSVINVQQLANAAELPVLGQINQVENSSMDLRRIWKEETNGSIQQYKDLLRSVRYEIEEDLKSKKLISVTSLHNGEGKTFITISLAYAFAKINKKVLVIDGNFLNPQISSTIKTGYFIEDYLNGGITPQPEGDVNVCGNRGGDYSLLEIAEGGKIEEKLKALHNIFDVIIVETSSMESLSKAKEWMMFSEMVIAVFEAGRSLKANQKVNIRFLKDLPQFAGFILNRAFTEEANPRKKSKKQT